jgi:hypothetical protein
MDHYVQTAPAHERIARIQAATLRNDAIDRCRHCNDDGVRADGTDCGH